MRKFVIRGDKGSKFESTQLDSLGEEATYLTEEEANNMLKQIQSLFRDEKFTVISVKAD